MPPSAMDEQRISAYLSLIQALLSCPSGEEDQILNQHAELIDEGFVLVCKEMAKRLQNEGKENKAVFLVNLAQQLAEYLNRKNSPEAFPSATKPMLPRAEYFRLLEEVLELEESEPNNPRILRWLLAPHQDKLNLTFAEIIKPWFESKLEPNNSQKNEILAETLTNFAIDIQSISLSNRANNIEIAIACFIAGLRVYTRQTFPEDWARVQYNLGNAYSHRIRGNKAENLEHAITCYQEVLQVYSLEAFPEDWAMTQNNLGIAYGERIRGERTDNLERAITCFRAALQVYSLEAFPQDWAGTQNNLGIAYKNRIRGNKAENLEHAITCYQEVLQVYSLEAFPEDWASTQHHLGAIYSERIRGDQAENLECAISYYKAALQVYTKESFHKDWARVQYNLGLAYSHRIRGERWHNIELAITYYNKALQIYTRQNFPEHWAMTQNNLGTAYGNRIQGERAENLEMEIACYEAALKVYTPEAFPKDWAMTQNNLGSAYSDRIRGDKAKNLESAISYGQAALQVYTPEAFPKDWAGTQNNLGNAYSKRIRGERSENLEQAITCYKAVLQVYTPETFPQDWMITQNNLGNAYHERIRGDKAENLEQAIKYYEETLPIVNREAFPEDWATTQQHLGSAYCDRIRGDKAENLEAAISYSQAALEVFTLNTFPEYWASAQANLGISYSKRLQGDKAENLECSINCYEAALQVYRREAFPEDWARTQNCLGNAYSKRIRGDRAQNIELAIACYQAALEVYTRKAFPQGWAMTQHNLGTAYKNRIQGDRGQNLETAIRFFQEVLEIRTRAAFPQKHTETLNNLGSAYQAQSIYYTSNPTKKRTALENAYTTFAQAIETVEDLRGEITSGDEVKRKLNEEWNQLYRGMVEVCLELKNYSAAIEYADRSKARNLVELIATRDAYPGGKIPIEVHQRLQYLRQAIDEENRRLAQDPNPDYTHIDELRQEFQAKFPYKPLEFTQIQSLLDEETAILEWYLLDNQFLTFILTPQTLHLWQSTPEDLKNLIDWANAYLHDYLNNKNQWQNRLPQRLEALAKILHLDYILHSLFEKLPHCKKLIFIPHRYLHLFPIHALPVHNPSLSGKEAGKGEAKPLQEWFPNGVSYAPSCQLLEQAQKRPRPDFNQLFAIQNPTQDLDFTDIEVEAIQSYFNPHHVLKHNEAEKTALDLNNAHCTHFSCHGYFNFNDPLKSALLLANSEFPPPAPDEDQTRYIPLKNGNLLDLGKCLTLEDILRLDLRNCRLVTLSACETGITDFTSSSDEYIGLPSGFLLAGSPNVVSSLWAVNDLSTALLMILFYENHKKKGETVPLALQHAQIWLRNATVEDILNWTKTATFPTQIKQKIQNTFDLELVDLDEQIFSHPFHWAAFCAIGQ